MVEKIEFDESGKAVVCCVSDDMELQKHGDMLMNIEVYRMKKGQAVTFYFEREEMAVLLTEGEILYEYGDKCLTAKRESVFSSLPTCLHVAKQTKVVVTSLTDSEIIVERTENCTSFSSKFYTPADCKIEKMGDTQWEGCAKREVVTVFDYHNAPYSNMVIGEVINKAGRWSSYVPHSHPQPEVYYYKFERPQGFGASFLGEEVFRITDSSASFIEGGLTHPQTAAPGYTMYYCWMIRHLEGNPWTDRDIDPQHAWLLEEN